MDLVWADILNKLLEEKRKNIKLIISEGGGRIGDSVCSKRKKS